MFQGTFYSCTVNVNCLELRLSNLFGGLMSKMAVMAIVNAMPRIKVTKIPLMIPGVMIPTQSYGLLNFVSPFKLGST